MCFVVSSPTTNSKPVVLTAEEFAQLTSQGMFKIQENKPAPQKSLLSPVSTSPIISPAPVTTLHSSAPMLLNTVNIHSDLTNKSAITRPDPSADLCKQLQLGGSNDMDVSVSLYILNVLETGLS